MKKEQTIPLPEKGTKVLLHACCAPCSGAIVEYMVNGGLKPVIFFSNSNITPIEEYELRRDECRRYAERFGLEFVEDAYDHKAWLEAVRGMEREPERGRRCSECFRFRLSRAAAYAAGNGGALLGTTLASSRWKDLEQVGKAGKEACADFEGVEFWDQNWRKCGLQERRNQIIKEMNFYNQLWCGCEFSHRDSH